ncbi:cAMP-binding protein [Thioflavicoccus mobilis 8321]|uniref:cAMP-binding protein n=1 Tax=Thioflavicoccus mobilis 8321 TaxID=765912 RepID=L0H381_9GAMM|nr:Crp/Fnr family transcriptional regulator [Thioflavicoccus mobilis]AGA92039.1 cAMP-binding protein [Thioflavicoccus mobilis 8321]
MIEVLRRTPLLSQLTEAQLQRVAVHAHERRLAEGEWLFAQGDAATRFYLVEAGQIRLFRLSADGAEKVIEIVSPGQTFAEALMFMQEPHYPVSAAALAPTTLIAIDASDFAFMLRESVDTCFVVLGALSRRLRALIGEIDDLTLHTARSRVARYLLSQCPADRRAFNLEIPKSVLASRLSIKPETFSRVIRQLTSEDLISMHGGHVTVRDRDALDRAADWHGELPRSDAFCPQSLRFR